MEAKIVENLITAKPKAGFFVMLGNEKKKIEEVAGNIVTMEDGLQYELEAVKDKIIRYVAKVNDKEFHLLYDDYGRVSDDQIHEGYTVDRPRNAHEGDMVRIVDINVIDEHGLHNLRDRKGEIIRPVPTGNKFRQLYEIQLETNRKVFKLSREQFTLLEEGNTRKFFHPRCTTCGN